MPNFKEITKEELKEKMDSGDNFVLLDVLGEDSYKNIYLPDAKVADAHQEKEDFLDDVEELVENKSQEVIVYCASFSCQLSPKAAGILAESGYDNIYDFEGGLKDWAKGGYDFEGEKAEEISKKLKEQD